VVFCEVKCRHGQPCEVLIATDRPHPVDGPHLAHVAFDDLTGQTHTWKSRPQTLVCTGQCHVEPARPQAKLSADRWHSRTITVRLPEK
jgi:hypothetical protein